MKGHWLRKYIVASGLHMRWKLGGIGLSVHGIGSVGVWSGCVGDVRSGLGCVGLWFGCEVAGLCHRLVGLLGAGIGVSSSGRSGSMLRSCDSSSFMVAALLSTSVSIIACAHTVCSRSLAVVWSGIEDTGWFVSA